MCTRISIVLIAALVFVRVSAEGQSWTQVAHGARMVVASPVSNIEAILPVASGNFLVGSYAGVARSTDNGGSWTVVDFGLMIPWAPAVYRHSDGRIFAGLADNRLMVSSDNGGTWNQVMTYPTNASAFRMCRNSQGTMFTASSNDDSSGGVYRSTDNGATWIQMLDSVMVEFITIGAGDVVYAGGQTGMIPGANFWRSTDGGFHWSRSLVGNGVRSIIEASDGSILAGTWVGASLTTQRSTDHGVTWTPCASFYAEYFATDTNHVIYTATNAGLYRSTDNGVSWEPRNSGLMNISGAIPWLRTVIRSGPNELLAGEYHTGELFRSTDLGAHWETFSTVGRATLEGAKYTSLTEKAPGQFFLSSSTYGIDRWSGSGPVVPVNTGLVVRSVQTVFPAPSGRVYAASASGIYRSTDNGSSWNKFGTTSLSFRALSEMSNGQLLGGVAAGVLKFDSAGSFTVMNTGLASRGTNALLTANDGRMFAGTDDGLYTYRTDSLEWVPLTISAAALKVIDIKADGQIIAAATPDSGVYVSANNGQSWAQKRMGLEGKVIRAIALAKPDKLYAATAQHGVFAATLSAPSWTAITQGLADLNMRGLLLAGNGYLYAVTDSGAITKTTQQVTGVEKAGTPVPAVFSLDQNFPNPFNPTTVIRYQLPALSQVELLVYDLLGQRVATIVNERQEPGMYEVTFDAAGLPSGVYLYRLTAGSSTQTRKMIAVK
jgi:hypothetical protein